MILACCQIGGFLSFCAYDTSDIGTLGGNCQ
jgi:hypothetical protein